MEKSVVKVSDENDAANSESDDKRVKSKEELEM